MQYFQGEQINIIINGVAGYNLETLNFGCVIYPADDLTKAVNIPKTSMTKVANKNTYIVHIASSVTKTLPVGIYNIEFYDDINDSIYRQPNVFNLDVSASVDYITSIS